MDQAKQLPGKWASLAAQPKTASSQPKDLMHATAAGGQQPAAKMAERAPIGPPAFRSHLARKVLQAKMPAESPVAQSRSTGCASAGVVQANVIGGNHALQARLNLWNTRLTSGANRKVSQDNGANFIQAPGARSQAIQRKTGHGVEAFRVPLRQKSGGMLIPDDVRAKMETAFGADFSDVRVHIGQEASSLGAIAYTWGTNIHFAPGQYNPHTLQGQKLLGHELWHVLQQKSGRVKNPFGGGVAVVQDHALEAEADRMGIKAALTQIVRRRKNK
jgi:hypothetical protein